MTGCVTEYNPKEKGDGEITAKLSALTLQLASGIKASHELLGQTNSSFHSELQQLGKQLSSVLEKGDNEMSSHVTGLTSRISSTAKESQEVLIGSVKQLQSELNQVADQFNAVVEKGNGQICSQLSALTEQIAVDRNVAQEMPIAQVDEESEGSDSTPPA